MIINERDLRHQSVVEAAHRMMTAARTAPKAKGVDIIEIALVEEREDLEKLAEAMRRRSEETGFKFLLRDADNILQGEAVILIGTRRHTQGRLLRLFSLWAESSAESLCPQFHRCGHCHRLCLLCCRRSPD